MPPTSRVVSLPDAAARAPPALLPVADSRGLLLGTALYSPASQIALRLVSREALNEAEWLQSARLKALRMAIARRKPLLDTENDACRLCFSEADELPGLVVDKYARLVILQLLAKGLDSAAVRETCVRVLREELAPAAILERPDPRMRELEGLAAPQSRAALPEESLKSNRHHSFTSTASSSITTPTPDRRPAPFSISEPTTPPRASGRRSWGPTGRALDVCCYQGGFALHLAQVCSQVTGIDASRASLEVAEQNLEANRAAPHRPGRLGGSRRLSDSARLVGRGRTIRHHRSRSARLRKNKTRRRRRSARLQGAEPARPQNAASRRPARHLLLLAPCGLGGAGRRGRLSRSRCGRGACACSSGAAPLPTIQWS